MSSSNSGRTFAAGFTIGVIIGLAVAFSYTPKSGKETRGMLKEKASDAAVKVKEIASDATGKAREIAGDRRKIYTKTWQESKEQPKTRVYAHENE